MKSNALNRFKRFFGREGTNAFQLERETKIKYDLILQEMISVNAKSVLDVGCNAGEITRLAGQDGFFSVGLDQRLDFRGVESPLNKACLGQMEMNSELIDNLPNFDIVLLLSVHHQLIEKWGDGQTKDFVKRLALKANKGLIIEFAALNSKYGKEYGYLFDDNSENEVVHYALSWLQDIFADHSCRFVGKAPQTKSEPYRFVFSCLLPDLESL